MTLYSLRVANRYSDLVKEGEYKAAITPSDPNVHEELCIGYYHTRQMRMSYRCLEKIFALRPVNSDILDRAIYNKKLFERMFVAERWVPSIVPAVGENRVVTVTITSCKRLNLFIHTIDSFIRCCVDQCLIAEFLCIDDNSSVVDRQIMSEKYPFIRFVFKAEKDRGHAKSMMMISEQVKTPYLFHLEDDWLMTNGICLSDLIEIMEDQEPIKQVCLQKNYMEVADKEVKGGAERYTRGNLRYFLHQYNKTREEQDAFRTMHGGTGLFCDYWPHFSLTPSLIDPSIFKVIQFKDAPGFEKTFAEQYAELGWVTAFHQEINCRHIGRLIGERDIPNAYELNNVQQF